MSASFVNLEPNQTNKEQKSIWLPSETWVNVFKFLTRRVLLQGVQPVCHRFHVLADQHVDNLHEIHEFERFLDELDCNVPGACMQYAQLVANNAILAKHFWVFGFNVECRSADGTEVQERRRCALRHLLELFQGCILDMSMNFTKQMATSDFLAYLELFQLIRPFYISIISGTETTDIHVDDLLKHPAILNCARLGLLQKNQMTVPNASSICNWLHHFADCEDNEQNGNMPRIFIYDEPMLQSTYNEIIECCKKLLQQSQSPCDRRAFLLIFRLDSQMPFRIDHPATGEVLHVQKFTQGRPYTYLRRCAIADLETADQLYHDTFEYGLEFRIPMKDGIKVPLLSFNTDVDME